MQDFRMKTLSFVFSFFLLGILCPTIYAQYENVWVFGRYAGLDFNSTPPVPVKSSITGFGEANASVCNEQGQLLFYTEGTVVWDHNGAVMPNGDSLIPVKHSNPFTPTSSSCQGALIMPMPGSNSKYYVFSITSSEELSAGRLYYSVVDMNLHNGSGDMVAGQKGVLLDSNVAESMTAVTGDRCNVWLLVRARRDNVFKAYSITASGINVLPEVSRAGTLYGPLYIGQMIVSPDGRKLVACNGSAYGPGDLEFLDFNRTTGTVSNAMVLDNNIGYYGAAFSPDGSKLYGATTSSSVYQFDLAVSEPEHTKTLVGTCSFTHLRLAPDGKIYFVSRESLNQLGTIDFPDRKGRACGYTENAIQLPYGSGVHGGLPNGVVTIVHDTAAPVTTSVQAPCWFNEYILQADTDGWEYLWDNNSTSRARTIYRPGTYWARYTTAPCRSHTDTFVVTDHGVLPRIGIDASCPGFSNGKAWAYTYPGDTIPYHYTWRNQHNDILSTTDTLKDVPAGSYSVQITTAACDTLLYLHIPPENSRVSFSADTLVCGIDTIRFQNTSDAYFTDFAWAFGDHTISDLQNPTHAYGRAGRFTVRLTGTGSKCSDTVYKDIIADARFPALFLAQPAHICAGEAIIFTTQQADHTLLSRSWTFGDQSDMKKVPGDHIQHAYDMAGVMPVTMQAHFRACPDTSFTDTVFVYGLPLVDLGPDSLLCLDQLPVTLSNRGAPAATPDRYLWSTGDTTAAIKAVQPGRYSLTVYTTPVGCSATGTIIIRKDCFADLPNAFTPNGDGYNDYFFPRQLLSQGVTGFTMQIISRWGQVVFETTNLEGRGWDGRWNGIEQPQGVYVYRVEVTLNGDRRERYENNVTLIR